MDATNGFQRHGFRMSINKKGLNLFFGSNISDVTSFPQSQEHLDSKNNRFHSFVLRRFENTSAYHINTPTCKRETIFFLQNPWDDFFFEENPSQSTSISQSNIKFFVQTQIIHIEFHLYIHLFLNSIQKPIFTISKTSYQISPSTKPVSENIIKESAIQTRLSIVKPSYHSHLPHRLLPHTFHQILNHNHLPHWATTLLRSLPGDGALVKS